jgi:hypothetical protein
MSLDNIRQFLHLISEQQSQFEVAVQDDQADEPLWETYYRKLAEGRFTGLPPLRTLNLWQRAEGITTSHHWNAIAAVKDVPANLASRWTERLDTILKRHLDFLDHCLEAAENRRPVNQDLLQEVRSMARQALGELNALPDPETGSWPKAGQMPAAEASPAIGTPATTPVAKSIAEMKPPTQGLPPESQVNLDSLPLADLLPRAEGLLSRLETYQRYAEASDYHVNLNTVRALGQCGATARQLEAELARVGLPVEPPEPLVTHGRESRLAVMPLREWICSHTGLWVALQPGTTEVPKLARPLAEVREIIRDLRTAAAEVVIDLGADTTEGQTEGAPDSRAALEGLRESLKEPPVLSMGLTPSAKAKLTVPATSPVSLAAQPGGQNPFRCLCEVAMQIREQECERDRQPARARWMRAVQERAELENHMRDLAANCTVAGKQLGREMEAEDAAHALAQCCNHLLVWEAAVRLGFLTPEEAAVENGGPCVALVNRLGPAYDRVDRLARLYALHSSPVEAASLVGCQPSREAGTQTGDGGTDWWTERARLRAIEERRKTLPLALAREVRGIHEALVSFSNAQSAYWHFRQGHPLDGKPLDEVLGTLVDAGIEVCKQLTAADRSEVLEWWWQHGERGVPKPAGRTNRFNSYLPEPSKEDLLSVRFWQYCRERDRAGALAFVSKIATQLTEESLSKLWKQAGQVADQLLTPSERVVLQQTGAASPRMEDALKKGAQVNVPINNDGGSNPVPAKVRPVEAAETRIDGELSNSSPVPPTAGTDGRKPMKQPKKYAITVYRYWFMTRKTQTELAEDPRLMELLGRKVEQGTISRWLKQVKGWVEAGNVLPQIREPLNSKPTAMDAERIDLGANLEHRPKYQRKRRNSDRDE